MLSWKIKNRRRLSLEICKLGGYMNKYINVIDKDLCDTLLSHGYKLLNSINSTNCKVWTFKYDPRLFSLNFEDKEVSKKCFLSDTLRMTF